jgi:hypothetical protein
LYIETDMRLELDRPLGRKRRFAQAAQRPQGGTQWRQFSGGTTGIAILDNAVIHDRGKTHKRAFARM